VLYLAGEWLVSFDEYVELNDPTANVQYGMTMNPLLRSGLEADKSTVPKPNSTLQLSFAVDSSELRHGCRSCADATGAMLQE
jgi:hypothetical protein